MPAVGNNNINKKYKLFSAASSPDGDGKPACAFFASAQGCRNGDNCKFAHIRSPQQQATKAGVVFLDSLVSSESEGEEVGRVETKPSVALKNNKSSNTYASMAKQPAEVDDDSSPFVKSASELQSSGKAKKRNKKRSSQSGNSASGEDISKGNDGPFAAPKSKKQKQMNIGVVTTVKLSNDKDSSAPKTQQKVQQPKVKNTPAVPSFRALDLPIASFSTLKAPIKTEDEPEPAKTLSTVPTPTQPQAASAPLPTSTESGRKWLKLVQQTRGHPRYNDNYDLSKYKVRDMAAGYAANSWVTSPPFTASKHAQLPQIIALDCEMCETRDPVSGQTDPRALCRISVVDVETDEVLLDSLVKPASPVSNYRSWVNGITAEHLEPVQFTLRHAQAFLLALCSQETVVLGQSLHNDLAALRWEHSCVADSACLFAARDSDTAVVALRDLARGILGIDMPTTHDSVHDARVAYQCLEHYRVHDGNVDAIVRTPRPDSTNNQPNAMDYARQLFVHRIPQQACDETQLAQMFVGHSYVKPTQVDAIEFGSSSNSGKTVVHFSTGRHAGLAFDTLDGTAEADASGRLQKKVYLRNGSYIRVRKMAFERKDSSKSEEGGSKNSSDSNKRRLSS